MVNKMKKLLLLLLLILIGCSSEEKELSNKINNNFVGIWNLSIWYDHSLIKYESVQFIFEEDGTGFYSYRLKDEISSKTMMIEWKVKPSSYFFKEGKLIITESNPSKEIHLFNYELYSSPNPISSKEEEKMLISKVTEPGFTSMEFRRRR